MRLGDSAETAQLVIAHSGDSRAILCQGKSAVRLTEDHKPNRKDEEKRIKLAGGQVINIGGVHRAAQPDAHKSGWLTLIWLVFALYGVWT